MSASPLPWVVASLVVPLVLSECRAWWPRLAEHLVRWSARMLGDRRACQRYEEEWVANLREVPGDLSPLLAAFGYLLAVPRMRWTLRRPQPAPVEPPVLALHPVPQHRTIFAVDIEGSASRNNAAKAAMRDDMYRIVEASLRSSGIAEDHYAPLVDRGDGILMLIRPNEEVPRALVLTRVIPMLRSLLAEHERSQPDQPLRLRAVMHAGPVFSDGRGHFGEALDVAFRLLNAFEVKQAFRVSRSPLYLVVSEQIYTSIVAQSYQGIDEQEFSQIVGIEVGEHRASGWVSPLENR